MSVDESIERMITLIDEGNVDSAIDAVDQAREQYGSEAKYLVYAQMEIRYLAWRYGKSGDWKSVFPTYAESLLSAYETSGVPGHELAFALKHYGHLLRYSHRDKQAIPILRTLMEKECENPQLRQHGYGPERTWSLLAECYDSISDSDSAAHTRNMVSEQSKLFRQYWAGNGMALREVAVKQRDETRQAQQDGSLRPMPGIRVNSPDKKPTINKEPPNVSDRPWWKFW